MAEPTGAQLPPFDRYVGVVGPGGDVDEQTYATAREVGRLVAARLHAVVTTGGLGGVMQAACHGAQDAGGCSIGLLPGASRADGNPFVTLSVATGLGELRNGVLVNSCDVIISVGGSWGTLSEIALALRAGKPVVGINPWSVTGPHLPDRLMSTAQSPAEAVDVIERLALWPGRPPTAGAAH